MSRFKVHIKYNGERYAGWQRQPNARSVQEEVEQAFSVYYKTAIEVVGCGRTDAGVHASSYCLHFDAEIRATSQDIKGLNAILPEDIAVYALERASDDFHARFSCIQRSYAYHLHKVKDPFLTGRSFQFHRFHHLDIQRVEKAAALITDYDAFFPFCKSHSGVEHYKCLISRSEWEWNPEDQTAVYRISANRFLRGMVRLVVGAQINVGLGQLKITDLEKALDEQTRLIRDWSVPACGLFLDGLVYP